MASGTSRPRGNRLNPATVRLVVAIGLEDIQAARERIGDETRNTPIKRSTTLSRMTGSDFHLKLENFQRTGSFKVRGAINKMLSLTGEEKARGVVAASAGNHAQGVAYAATTVGVESHVFMPAQAAHAKVVATKGYGAHIHLQGDDYQDAFDAAEAFCNEKGGVFVHAFDDPYIMAGQGTLGLEVLEEIPDLEVLLVPIGGGGLIGGVATAVKALKPDVYIIGVQAEGSSTVAPSLQKGRVVPLDEVHTMADGIACRKLGELPFKAIQQHVDQVVTVDESEIAAAILFLLERTKVAVEGAGAVTLAAAMHGHVDLTGKKTCAVVSGGNIDMTLLSRIIQRGLVKEGRIVVVETDLNDKPGAIADFLQRLGDAKANVMDVQHDRLRTDVALHQTHVEVHVETRGPEHVAQLRKDLTAAGYDVIIQDA